MAGDSWEPWQLSYLREHYGTTSAGEMSKAVGRSEGAVRVMLHRMGLSVGRTEQLYVRCPGCGMNRHIKSARVDAVDLRSWVLVQTRRTDGYATGFVNVPEKNVTVGEALQRRDYVPYTTNLLKKLVRLGREAEQLLRER